MATYQIELSADIDREQADLRVIHPSRVVRVDSPSDAYRAACGTTCSPSEPVIVGRRNGMPVAYAAVPLHSIYQHAPYAEWVFHAK